MMGIELSPTDDELRNRAGIFFPQSLIRNDVKFIGFFTIFISCTEIKEQNLGPNPLKEIA